MEPPLQNKTNHMPSTDPAQCFATRKLSAGRASIEGQTMYYFSIMARSIPYSYNPAKPSHI